MKGKIFCDSIEKVGTQMSVILPMAKSAADEEPNRFPDMAGGEVKTETETTGNNPNTESDGKTPD
jgi:hypothetical protein